MAGGAAADRTCGHGPDSVAAEPEPEPGPPRSAELRTDLSCKRTIGEVFTIMEKAPLRVFFWLVESSDYMLAFSHLRHIKDTMINGH